MLPTLVVLLSIAFAAPAGAVLVPYEAADGTAGASRGNNLLDATPLGACGFTIVGGNIHLTGCRTRTLALCPTGAPCDLDRVPAGRCTQGTSLTCIWPNGAGFCTLDPNVGCLTNAQCDPDGAGPVNFGVCDTSPCPGGDCSGCACQGTDDSLATFETHILSCGSLFGVCSDGDAEFAYAPAMSGGLCFNR